MAQINVLSKETIDKIAAGEVVERPSSVVKELLENAVDAKASAVTVEIKEGGISFIRVTDNGSGIGRKEVPKAFLRHATSKISSAEDLFHIRSLGFRGEALSSIAAVSRLELITKTREELTGIRYLIEGGEEKETEEIGAPDGTTIIVRNLFFNTPVRKKFLKQPQTEGGYVSDLMEHIAMSHPGISFKYINNGQVRFHTSGNNDLQEIIYRIYGRDISAKLIPIDAEENGIHMYGFLGKPEVNRSNRNFEIYFINGRFIKSNVIGKAIEDGYKKYVMQHKFPFAVLHFEISSEEIDVNVHPTKMEVRFTNQTALYDVVSRHIMEALHRTELIPEVVLEKAKEEKQSPQKAPEPFEAIRFEKEFHISPSITRERNEPVVKEECVYGVEPENRKIKEPPKNKELPQVEELPPADNNADAFFVDNRIVPKKEERAEKPTNMQDVLQNGTSSKIYGERTADVKSQNAKNHANIIKASEHIIVEKPMQLNLFEEKMLTREARNEYRILGQVFDTYWLVAFQDKLFIIDQHAAHEKVKFETFMDRLKTDRIQSQMLNPPIIVTLSGQEESVLREYMEFFEQMGFEIEEFGGNEYAIRSVPADLYGLSENTFFTEMLDELTQGPVKGAPDIIRQKIATMACKAAIKGNMSFGMEEISELLDQLLSLEDPYHCPHGRPTIISMSKYEMEKKFKRII